MITICDRCEALDQNQTDDEHLKRLSLGAVPDGYLPDENDPAWPSRSGQGD